MNNFFYDIKQALLKELSDRLVSVPYIIKVRDTDTGEVINITHVEACFMQTVLYDILDADNVLRNGTRQPDGVVSPDALDCLLVEWIDDYNIEDEQHAVSVMFTCDDPTVEVVL